MIKKIRINNFRSIEHSEIDIAPLTIFYGPTGGGKSSFLYSLLVLKNFVMNPNQQVDGFFNMGFVNLGGFENCAFNQKEENAIDMFYEIPEGEYGISLQKNTAEIRLTTKYMKMKGDVNIPYGLNKNFTFVINENDQEFTVNWNGITSTVSPKQNDDESQNRAKKIAHKINQIPEYLKKIDIVPHRRGFFLPNYSPGQISIHPTSDVEVATIIINDPNLAPKISTDLEKILNRDFRIYTPPGTATAFFQSTDKTSRTPSYLVNDGFGVNQIVYLLAKIHRSQINTILIEEPEVHLHPSIIRLLVKTLCSIIKEERKQMILSTHSEVFVSSVLAAVKRKEVEPKDVLCYLVKKEQKITKIEKQEIDDNGQIKGGLSSFIEGELEDLSIFFE